MRNVLVGLGVLAACSPQRTEPRGEPGAHTEAIRVPGQGAARAAPAEARGDGLAAEEGTLEVVAVDAGSVGHPATARIRIVPGKGFHINTSYPFVVTLATTPGLTLAKARLEGGKRGATGDAETLAERELSIPITVTPTTAGAHTLTGSFSFGICKSDVCLSRTVPLALAVAAS